MCFLHCAILYRPTCFDLLLLKSFKVSNCLFLPPVANLLISLRINDFTLNETTQALRLYRTKKLNRSINLDAKRNFERTDFFARWLADHGFSVTLMATYYQIRVFLTRTKDCLKNQTLATQTDFLRNPSWHKVTLTIYFY